MGSFIQIACSAATPFPGVSKSGRSLLVKLGIEVVRSRRAGGRQAPDLSSTANVRGLTPPGSPDFVGLRCVEFIDPGDEVGVAELVRKVASSCERFVE